MSRGHGQMSGTIFLTSSASNSLRKLQPVANAGNILQL